MPRPIPPTLEPYTSQLPDVNNAATWAERTPLFWNWVTGDGYINLTSLLDYSEEAIDFIDNALSGSETLVDAVAALQSQIGGRNLIINGDFRINQRGYVSGTPTSGANEFTLDRWFVITSGQSVTFTGDESGRTVTAPAGGLGQVIKGANIKGGTYVAHWIGDGTVTVGGVTRSKGETFTLTANANATVVLVGEVAEFQLERGLIPTPFGFRDEGYELWLCQEYYQRGQGRWQFDGIYGGGGGTTFGAPIFFARTMRATPTLATVTSAQGEATGPIWSNAHANGAFVSWQWTNTAVTIARAQAITFAADAELTS